ncbi:type I methionyl aminopeptidase [Sphingobacterium pedocola]|uniref:Methionine aminopeptidase n=1 Tax=Sphingobacterium pedocola TaxID=2082722 RepID=A0ABR9T349_9SPHI|nr:type I methionyl aminopeptidase [Sphingobacterium pedocola]MBE8719289.1 type I methionyl aminopeptidase [Sphingobacterium pedocola]
MIISNDKELREMKLVSEVVSFTLMEMQNFAAPGMSTQELDDYGATILARYGARSAPSLTYDFPGSTCISINNEVAHGVPSASRIIEEGDLLNIDVSAELNGYWSDNGGSIIVGRDIYGHSPLLEASRYILDGAIARIRGGVRINAIGQYIETFAGKRGYSVIKNLAGHGLGRALHESPDNILNYYDPSDKRRFRKGSVVAIETFITTGSTLAIQQADGWTLLGNKAGFAVQHEHTIVVTDGEPIVLTERFL